MGVEFTGRHMEIAPAVRALAERKMGKLPGCCPGSPRARHPHRGEAAPARRGHRATRRALDLVATEARPTSRPPSPRCFDKLTGRPSARRQAARGQAAHAGARGGPAGPAARGAARGGAPGDGRPRIIRNRRFAAKPMTLEEAALEVGASADGVLVFRDAATGRITCSSGARTATSASSSRKREPREAHGGCARPPTSTALPPRGPSLPVRELLEPGSEAVRCGWPPARAGLEQPDHPRPRPASRPRPHRLHRLHPLRPRADPGGQRARLPAQAHARPPRRRPAAPGPLPHLLLRGDQGAGARRRSCWRRRKRAVFRSWSPPRSPRPSSRRCPRSSRTGWPSACTCTPCSWTSSAWAS